MRRMLLCTAVLMCVLLLLQSCSFDIKSIDSLIRAPKLTGENAAIQKAFEAAAGKDVVLVSPSAGSYRSSYVMVDFDNDSTAETIVLYSKKAAELTVRVHFLDNVNGEWVSVADVSTGGSDVYEIRLASIDNDNIPEILITWSVMDTNKYKYLTVFKTTNEDKKGIAAIATIQVDEYSVFDINVDGVNEIFYTYFESSTDKYLPFAAVQRYDSESKSFLQIGEAEINSLAVSFVSYSFDMKEGVNRIYIDCMRSDGLYFTELLCWDPENSLLLAPLSENMNSAALTSRSSGVFCKDIAVGGETDGLIEIPFEESPQGSASIGDSSGINGTVIVRTWFAYTAGDFVPVSRSYVNNNDGYELLLDNLYGKTVIVQYEDSGITEFYNNENGERGELLFTITAKSGVDYGEVVSTPSVQQTEMKMSIIITQAAMERNITEEDISAKIMLL